jgi:hypothetical protein
VIVVVKAATITPHHQARVCDQLGRRCRKFANSGLPPQNGTQVNNG